MTNRERMLAVVRHKPADRVPFVQYSNIGAPDDEVWQVIGRENMGLLRWCQVGVCHHPHCRVEAEEVEIDGRAGRRATLSTPQGTLTEERLVEPTFGTTAAHSHFIKEPADYEILLAYLRDAVIEDNLENVQAIASELGDDGLPHCAVQRTPYQQLWVQWVNAAELSWHLLEHEDLLMAVMAEMGRIQRQLFDIAVRAPVPYINFPDNITAPMIGPEYFRRFCVPWYRELADRLAEDNIPVFVHMDGDLKPLWDEIAASGVRGLDSMSPPPDNDTSVANALHVWPDMSLGINFPSSVHLRDAPGVYAATREILEQGGSSHRLQIQVSENPPKGAWRTSYPEIVRAIRDYAES